MTINPLLQTEHIVVTQDVLDNVNVEQARNENRAYLDTLGGVDGLVKLIGSNPVRGVSTEQVVVQRDRFGRNQFPEAPMKSFFELWYAAFQDPTLMILVAAAIVSLVIGLVEPEEGSAGWIEGAAILIAVFLVSTVSAGNDYTKELQFRALESSSAADERCSVIRDGDLERINPVDLVVGDVILLQVRCADPNY